MADRIAQQKVWIDRLYRFHDYAVDKGLVGMAYVYSRKIVEAENRLKALSKEQV